MEKAKKRSVFSISILQDDINTTTVTVVTQTEHSRSNSKGCLTTIVCFVISTTIIGMAIVGLFN